MAFNFNYYNIWYVFFFLANRYTFEKLSHIKRLMWYGQILIGQKAREKKIVWLLIVVVANISFLTSYYRCLIKTLTNKPFGSESKNIYIFIRYLFSGCLIQTSTIVLMRIFIYEFFSRHAQHSINICMCVCIFFRTGSHPSLWTFHVCGCLQYLRFIAFEYFECGFNANFK